MNKYSIHIGLNYVDPKKYQGWKGSLKGCINDCNAMQKISNELGYELSFNLKNETATRTEIESTLWAIMKRQGNVPFQLLITYSGHGGQIPDISNDESDGLDETLCLYDGMITDDWLHDKICKANRYGDTIIISDSCHSGSISKTSFFSNYFNSRTPKNIPTLIAADYIDVNSDAKRTKRINGIISLTSCKDHQVSYDGKGHGLFTESLLNNYKKGITYVELTGKIRKDIGRIQDPSLRFRNTDIRGRIAFM